ncbi:MAG: hypothetical protein MUF58_00645, partial [Arcicella sp.]|nr:hypothetical protein [Arcicella sp.]
FVNKDSLELVKANDTITKEFENEKNLLTSPEEKDDFVTENQSSKREEKPVEKTFTESTNSVEKTKSKKRSETSRSVTNQSESNSQSNSNFDPAKEEQNYNALLQQKEKWTTIKADLQNTLNSGNTAAAEKLKNSEKVLERIEIKLRESAKKMGRN